MLDQFRFITLRIQRMREGNVSTGVCLLTAGGGGDVAIPWTLVPDPFWGDTPSPVTGPVQSPVPGPARGGGVLLSCQRYPTCPG